VRVLVRAIIGGVGMAAVGTIPWALLGWANLTYLPSIPWTAPIVAVHLWMFWRYAGGEGWPHSTARERRENRRANPVDGAMWGMAMLAGILGLFAIVATMGVLSRMVEIPGELRVDTSRLSFLTLFYLITASAIVSGVVEEISYRGYLQRPIERRFGFPVALLVSGVLFGVMHFTHPGVGLSLLPYYVVVSAVYGGLAWLTDSVYPSMALHAFGNFFGSVGLLVGRGDWSQEVASRAPLIWKTGPDPAFWGSLALLAVIGAVTIAAFVVLAKQRRTVRVS
jgi:membrane protease YdiL (CAAX protease family)